VTNGSFQLVDQTGTPVTPTGAVSGITLSAEGDPGNLAPGQTADPLWDATHATPGGGDTGSVLISPYIRPGTVSRVFYNHYSWLRTMEDLFQVSHGNDHATLPAGTVSGGLDGAGHLGSAAQPGLAPFGPDVFTNPRGVDDGHGSGHHGFAALGSRTDATGIGFGAVVALAMMLWYRRQRRHAPLRTIMAA
jgi:hypothetical protein